MEDFFFFFLHNFGFLFFTMKKVYTNEDDHSMCFLIILYTPNIIHIFPSELLNTDNKIFKKST